MANVGKLFETDFKNSFNKYLSENKLSVDRFHDGVGGYAVKNISDFVLYKYPNEYYLELKCYKGTRISYDAISDKQLKGLLEKSKIKGVRAGVLFNYNEHFEIYFIPIEWINEDIEKGRKSIAIEDARIYGAILPISKKRKVTFDYNIMELIENIERLYND